MGNIGEFIIPTTKLRADGYCKQTNTIYEFYGDKWHGNLNIFKPDDINTVSGKKYIDLYNKTIEREKIIINLKFNLITI